MPLIDHIEFAVENIEKARAFYERALAPLGVTLLVTIGPNETRNGGTRLGFGANEYPSLWLHDHAAPGKVMHVAFEAASRAEVRQFYEEALAAGGRDNGPPGIRDHYHSRYYAAFVLDPDGVNVEAVYQGD